MTFQKIDSQKGFTFWGFLWGSVFFIFICYLVIITVPPYLDDRKLQYALDSLSDEPGILHMDRTEMIRLLHLKLGVYPGDDIVDLDKVFKITPVGAKKDLSIDYEIAVPIVHNISLLFDFRNHVIVPEL